MKKQTVPFIFAIITLSLQVVFVIMLLFVSKLGSMVDGLVMALWTWPLLLMGILSLVFGLVLLRKEEYKKKAVTTTILGCSAILLFFMYAIMLGFFIGTGHLPFYYIINGF